jgi:GNAT superfamily N-acetyltransferase
MSAILAPVALAPDHDVSGFENGRHAGLDDWLKRRARPAEGSSARTYVIAAQNSPKAVIGYHCILAAMAEPATLPTARLRRDMPDAIPLLLIGRLAVDRRRQGQGLGSSLLIDAVQRSVRAANIVGARAVAAHAIDDAAAMFYERHGFLRAPNPDRLMLLPMETARTLVSST